MMSPLIQGLDVKVVSCKYEKTTRKIKTSLNSDPPARVLVCTNVQPIEQVAWKKEKKSQKKTVFNVVVDVEMPRRH
jgi:hypothetical protein